MKIEKKKQKTLLHTLDGRYRIRGFGYTGYIHVSRAVLDTLGYIGGYIGHIVN
jgi:hypothetical protein